jgi:hypothetical protein
MLCCDRQSVKLDHSAGKLVTSAFKRKIFAALRDLIHLQHFLYSESRSVRLSKVGRIDYEPIRKHLCVMLIAGFAEQFYCVAFTFGSHHKSCSERA